MARTPSARPAPAVLHSTFPPCLRLRGGGIYYNVTSSSEKTVSVTYKSSSDRGYSGVVHIPTEVEYNGTIYRVTEISSYAFSGCTDLTEVTIPNSVTEIGKYAFDYCTGLNKVIISNIAAWCGISFSTWESNPLYYARHLYSDENTETTELVIPNSVTSIGMYAFCNCTELTKLTIPNSVTSIGGSAFGYCTGLTQVTIPNSVTTIGSYAFYKCTGLSQVTIPNSVTEIKGDAFNGCTGLTEVTIPNSVTSIHVSTFYNCTGLTKVTIPNSVTSIGWDAFRGCTGLTEVTIPNSVTEIGQDAFRGCTGLTRMTIPNSVTEIGFSAFYYCTRLTELTIADGAETLKISTNSASSPFGGCPIKTLYLGRNISYSNSWVSSYSPFKNNKSLKTMTIGNCVTTIGNYAFEGCTAIASVTSLNTTPPTIYFLTFDTTTEKNATLHVPEGCKTAYLQSQYWKNFFSIQEDAVDGIEQTSVDTEQGSEQGDKTGIYTLNGTRLSTTDPSTLPKGIYIIDGKKTAIK